MEKIQSEEQLAKLLYDSYGITEWHEKCLILSTGEQKDVLKSLKYDAYNKMTEIVKLPFSKFIVEYYKHLGIGSEFIRDPEFGYKIYLAGESNMKALNYSIKYPEMTIARLYEEFGVRLDMDRIKYFLEMPFEKMVEMNNIFTRNHVFESRYVYISQYISAKDAEEMQLGSKKRVTFKDLNGNYRSFDLNGKLAILNPGVRTIVEKTLGLYGLKPMTRTEISEVTGISASAISKVVNLIIPELRKSTEEFKNKLGFLTQLYLEKGKKYYSYKPFRELDRKIEKAFTKKPVQEETKELTEEEFRINLYRKYGIAEWREKCLILDEQEQQMILNNLNAYEKPLVNLARLPFPKFIEAYYKLHGVIKTVDGKPKYNVTSGYVNYLKDPSFGYRMYLLTDSEMKILNAHIMHPEMSKTEIAAITGATYSHEVDGHTREIMETPYERILRLNNDFQSKKDSTEKFVYISQYITKEEAIKMGLTGLTYISNHEYLPDGFDLEGKLNSLNEPERMMIVRRLGLYGYDRTPKSAIPSKMGFTTDYIGKAIEYIVPALTASTGEFRAKLGYKPENDIEGSIKEYINPTYQKIDQNIMFGYAYKNLLTEQEREILATRSNKEQRIYIAKKYFYKTNEQVINNLSLAESDLKRFRY